MMRIDDLDAFSRHEPQFAVGGLRDTRTVGAGRARADPDTVLGTPNRRFDPALRVDDPCVQFRPPDAHEAAGRVQPQRTIIILYRPVNRVARQPVLAGQRSDAAVFYAAEAALLGCSPQRPVPIELEIGDRAFAQTISGCVGHTEPAILEIRETAIDPESKPNSVLP